MELSNKLHKLGTLSHARYHHHKRLLLRHTTMQNMKVKYSYMKNTDL